ncbi:MAG TPA: PQQ-binding-like beta-propeller repeat protein [Bacteroidales bacterium]|nr:PQQ-binding-like beta-propeller repeat protein [Bacteroidales bacterium]
MKFSFLPVAAFSALMFCSCSNSNKTNWPQFRGADGNIVTSNILPEKWDSVTNIRWTYDINGTGFSSPIVWGDRIFVASAFGEKVNPLPERQGPPPPPANGQQQGPQPGQNPPQMTPPQQSIDSSFMKEVYRLQLACIDLNSGKELWKQIVYKGTPKTGKHPMSSYGNETPVTDGERVYVYFGMMGLYCYDLEGKLLWQKDFGSYYTQMGWGTGSSPVLYNGTLFIQIDNEMNSFIVALDAATGNEKWKVSRTEKTTYSSPFIWTNNQRTELIANGKTAYSYDPETGKVLWQLNVGGDQVIPTPVGNTELLIIGTAGGREIKADLYAVKPGASGDITPVDSLSLSPSLAWKIRDAGLSNPSPLLYEDKVYLIGNRGEVTIIDASKGEKMFYKRVSGIGSCWATPWIAGNKVHFLDENGKTRTFNTNGEISLTEESSLKDKTWASVAITDDAYILRGQKKLWCVGE